MSDMSIWVPAISALVGSVIGAVVMPWLSSVYSNGANRKIRKICIRALDIFKEKGKFSSAEEEFNSELGVSEKRAVLVALHKIGVPVASLEDGVFDIKQVRFLSNEVLQAEISLMKQQVNRGLCDNYFFMDCDVYFKENLKVKTLRNLAKRYVDSVLAKSRLDSGIILRGEGISDFSLGEINILLTFNHKNSDPEYYNEYGLFKKDCLDKLKKDIDDGLWDNYLQWDYGAYQNMESQKKLAQTLVPTFTSKPLQ